MKNKRLLVVAKQFGVSVAEMSNIKNGMYERQNN
jgi:hypothetical protein